MNIDQTEMKLIECHTTAALLHNFIRTLTSMIQVSFLRQDNVNLLLTEEEMYSLMETFKQCKIIPGESRMETGDCACQQTPQLEVHLFMDGTMSVQSLKINSSGAVVSSLHKPTWYQGCHGSVDTEGDDDSSYLLHSQTGA